MKGNSVGDGAGCPSKSHLECSGNGKCIKYDDSFACQCDEGSTGLDCNIPYYGRYRCPNDCTQHGRCDLDGRCFDSRFSDRIEAHVGCDPGWTGLACNETTNIKIGCQFTPEPKCHGHGHCNVDGACFDTADPAPGTTRGCEKGWSGGTHTHTHLKFTYLTDFTSFLLRH